MNIKDLIWGIVLLIGGVLGLIWVIKNPPDKDSETPYLDKQWDIRGYIGAFTFILVGIIFIVKGSGIVLK